MVSYVTRLKLTGFFSFGVTGRTLSTWSETENLQQLKACMRDAVAIATHKMLQNMWKEFKYHLDICCATRSAVPTLKSTKAGRNLKSLSEFSFLMMQN